jgi:hypothetical protein
MRTNLPLSMLAMSLTIVGRQAARSVPGLLFVGGKDLDSRIQTITGLFALNRRAGALWALSEEPSAAHIVGRSRDLALMSYEDMLAARVSGSGPLKSLSEKAGFLGDAKTKTFQPIGETSAPSYPTAWLPTERVAKAWRAVLTETPFE